MQEAYYTLVRMAQVAEKNETSPFQSWEIRQRHMVLLWIL